MQLRQKLSADLHFHRFENWYQLPDHFRRALETLARAVYAGGVVFGPVFLRLPELPPLSCVIEPRASDGHEVVHVYDLVAHLLGFTSLTLSPTDRRKSTAQNHRYTACPQHGPTLRTPHSSVRCMQAKRQTFVVLVGLPLPATGSLNPSGAYCPMSGSCSASSRTRPFCDSAPCGFLFGVPPTITKNSKNACIQLRVVAIQMQRRQCLSVTPQT